MAYSPPPSTPPWHDENWFHSRGVIAAVFAFIACTLVFKCMCTLCPCPCYVNNHLQDEDGAARGPPPPPPEPQDGVVAASSLPAAFAYSLPSAQHKVTSAGEEAATTCSVCLGAFQAGETVRLLPVCLHLYHAKCIDPWLARHSTCPVCRSATDMPHAHMLEPILHARCSRGATACAPRRRTPPHMST